MIPAVLGHDTANDSDAEKKLQSAILDQALDVVDNLGGGVAAGANGAVPAAAVAAAAAVTGGGDPGLSWGKIELATGADGTTSGGKGIGSIDSISVLLFEATLSPYCS